MRIQYIYILRRGLNISQKMARLSGKEFWNSIYSKSRGGDRCRSRARKSKSYIGDLLDKAGVHRKSYSKYLLNNLFGIYFTKPSGSKILEIGSAPGDNLIYFKNTFGYEPYGIDYSESGVEINRTKFAEHGIPADRITHSDFFDPTFQSRYKGYFDIVTSFGFIEHFSNPKNVVEMHFELLKSAGILFVEIPNYSYINYFLMRMLKKNTLKHHNLSIMDKNVFLSLFSDRSLKMLFCDYIGTLNLFMFHDDSDGLKSFITDKILGNFQVILNVLFASILKHEGMENKFTSPYLVAVCKKV
jgi:2-polyprenyl-3-methyl-5-hydroxy-6-metoxy-1,4-benzoquinol methylase